MTHTLITHRGVRPRARVSALVVAGTVAALMSCKDSNIPFFTAPTSVSPTPAGIQNALSGLFAATRIDIGTMTITVSGGYGRDGGVFTNTEPRTVTYPMGVIFTPNTSGGIWPQEYQNIRQAYLILNTLPNVAPAYSAGQIASLTGVVQTIEAYNYMMIAEAHDTLGLAILPNSNVTTPPPAVCMKDAWEYITALLDSAEGNLETAGPVAPPIVLPTGFAGVGAASGPPTTSGSFASLNRALAGKAHLELAYAIARTPTNGGAAPTVSTPGSPDPTNLATALADLDSSAMYDSTGASLAPNSPSGFTPSSRTVTWDFSAASNDLVNPVQQNIGTDAMLNDFIVSVDTVHDLRFKAKFIINPNPVQQQTYAPVALETHLDPTTGRDSTYSWLYDMYATPGAPIPFVRNEELTLLAAQIHLGQGDLVGALKFANLVRTAVGGLADTTPAMDYVDVRNMLLKEQRVSTVFEPSADRTIALRMYGLVLAADTTWGTPGVANEAPGVTSGDVHTTVNPIPQTEINGRGGTFVTTCN